MERRNAEGYHDPTAYGGMRMAEQKAEKETVRMVYKNGRMELYIHEFLERLLGDHPAMSGLFQA